jgi:hypothetical protein
LSWTPNLLDSPHRILVRVLALALECATTRVHFPATRDLVLLVPLPLPFPATVGKTFARSGAQISHLCATRHIPRCLAGRSVARRSAAGTTHVRECATPANADLARSLCHRDVGAERRNVGLIAVKAMPRHAPSCCLQETRTRGSVDSRAPILATGSCYFLSFFAQMSSAHIFRPGSLTVVFISARSHVMYHHRNLRLAHGHLPSSPAAPAASTTFRPCRQTSSLRALSSPETPVPIPFRHAVRRA